MMDRRTIVVGLGASAIGALPARAQKAPAPVIGYLCSESRAAFASRLKSFLQGLAAAGYEDGRNVLIEYRWAEGHNERLPAMAEDLVRRNVSVIVAPGGINAAGAAQKATSIIPIVFEMGADPVGTGLVASLSKPGGNITGVTSLNAEIGPKRLELLHELMPSATRFALLVNPTNPRNAEPTTRDLLAAAAKRGLKLEVLEASDEPGLTSAFARLAEMRPAGLVIANETFYAVRSEMIAALSLAHKMPAVHQSREFVAAGGLMSYGGDVAESHREAGIYTGRILEGEKPGNLPVQQVKRVRLFVNLSTAKALGLTIPPAILLRADEVIE